jgi:hypothetical protein
MLKKVLTTINNTTPAQVRVFADVRHVQRDNNVPQQVITSYAQAAASSSASADAVQRNRNDYKKTDELASASLVEDFKLIFARDMIESASPLEVAKEEAKDIVWLCIIPGFKPRVEKVHKLQENILTSIQKLLSEHRSFNQENIQKASFELFTKLTEHVINIQKAKNSINIILQNTNAELSELYNFLQQKVYPDKIEEATLALVKGIEKYSQKSINGHPNYVFPMLQGMLEEIKSANDQLKQGYSVLKKPSFKPMPEVFFEIEQVIDSVVPPTDLHGLIFYHEFKPLIQGFIHAVRHHLNTEKLTISKDIEDSKLLLIIQEYIKKQEVPNKATEAIKKVDAQVHAIDRKLQTLEEYLDKFVESHLARKERETEKSGKTINDKLNNLADKITNLMVGNENSVIQILLEYVRGKDGYIYVQTVLENVEPDEFSLVISIEKLKLIVEEIDNDEDDDAEKTDTTSSTWKYQSSAAAAQFGVHEQGISSSVSKARELLSQSHKSGSGSSIGSGSGSEAKIGTPPATCHSPYIPRADTLVKLSAAAAAMPEENSSHEGEMQPLMSGSNEHPSFHIEGEGY